MQVCEVIYNVVIVQMIVCFQDIPIKQNILKYWWNGQHGMLSNVILLSIFEKNKWSSFISAGDKIN